MVKEKRKNLILAILCITIPFCIYQIFCNRTMPPGYEEVIPSSDTPIEAYIVSKKFVLQRLKAPRSAVFPDYTDSGVGVSRYQDGKYVVTGYVDSQNSFGAMLRTGYVCTINYVGNGNYELSEFVFLK